MVEGRVPPLPQPVAKIAAMLRSAIHTEVCVCLRRLLQKNTRAAGRMQSSVVLRDGWFAAVVASVTVLMVAMAFCGAPLRVTLEGRSEQVAYWPGVMGVQLRTTVPL